MKKKIAILYVMFLEKKNKKKKRIGKKERKKTSPTNHRKADFKEFSKKTSLIFVILNKSSLVFLE